LFAKGISDFDAVMDAGGWRYLRWKEMVEVPGYLYHLEEYENAIRAYRALLEKCPSAEEPTLLLLGIAKCRVMLKDYEAARKTLTKLIEDFPASPYVRKAVKYRKYIDKQLAKQN